MPSAIDDLRESLDLAWNNRARNGGGYSPNFSSLDEGPPSEMDDLRASMESAWQIKFGTPIVEEPIEDIPEQSEESQGFFGGLMDLSKGMRGTVSASWDSKFNNAEIVKYNEASRLSKDEIEAIRSDLQSPENRQRQAAMSRSGVASEGSYYNPEDIKKAELVKAWDELKADPTLLPRIQRERQDIKERMEVAGDLIAKNDVLRFGNMVASLASQPEQYVSAVAGPLAPLTATIPAKVAYDNAYVEAIEGGLTPEDADKFGKWMMSSEYAFEAFSLFGKGAKATGGQELIQKAFKEWVKRGAKAGGKEAAQEAATGTLQDTGNWLASKIADEETTQKFLESQTPEDLGDFATRRYDEALAGFFGGGTMTAVPNALAIRQQNARARDILNSTEPTGDPAFDAGQQASAENMIEADRTQPGELNDLMSNPPPIQPDLFQDQQATEVGQLRTPEQNQQILEDQAKAQIEVQKQKEEGFKNIEQVGQRTREAERLASEGSVMADALRKSGAIETITPTKTQTETTTEAPPEPVQQQIQFPKTPEQKQVESVVGKVEETARKKEASEKKTAATRRTTERNKFIAQTVAQKMESGVPREEAIQTTAAVDLPAWDKANPVTKFTKTEQPTAEKVKKSKNKKAEAPVDLGQVNFEDLRKGLRPEGSKPKFTMRDPAEAEMQAYLSDQSDLGEELSVVGEDQAGPFVNNASGESAASAEAISRLNDERSKGMMRAVLRPTGEVVPLVTAADVDHTPQQGEMIVQRQQDGSWGVLDSGTVPRTLVQSRINSASNSLTASAQEMGYTGTTARMAQRGRTPRRGKLPLITKPDGNTEISDHIKSGTSTVKTLLEKVRANVDSEFHRELVDKLSSLGLDSKISISTIENAPDDVKAAHAKGENPAAWYQDGEITFLDTALNDNEGDVAWYAVHETTHAATEEVINKPDKVLTHSQRSAKKQLMSLYERVKKHESVKGQYGLTDISEFMAEAWSNKEFQDILRNIKIGGVRNVWNQFISGVRQLLGMKPGEHNALSEAIRIGDVIMESQRPEDGGAIRPMVSEETLSRPAKKGGVEIDLVNTEKAKQKGVHKKGDTPEGTLRKTIESWTRSGGSLNNIVREIVEYGQQGSTEKGIVARNIGREIQSYLNKNDSDGTLREALTKAVRGREGAISQVNAALADHPELKSIVDEAIRSIKLNAIDILEQSYKHGIKIPDHIARKILKSATDADYLYVTRNFMKDDPKGGGKRYSEGMARAAGIESGLDQQVRRKLDNLAEKLATKGSLGKAFFGKKAERIKDYRRRVLNAMQYFMTNDLYIPDADGLGEMKTKNLDRLHHTYFGDFLDGQTADSLKAIYPNETEKKRKSRARKLNRQRKIEDLLGARERQETEGDWKEKELYPRAERLVKDILGLTDQETASQLAKYYGAGERADLTIVTERKSIPKPVLELMGEHEDAAYNLFSTLNRQAEFISRQRMMQEMLKLEGTHVFKEQDANPIIHKETLNGPTFGPLQGMRVTPEVKSYLDAKLEATETFGKILKDMSEGKTSNYGQRLYGALASSIVRPITRFGKFVSVATNVAGIAMNGLGSPFLLMSDGNFSPKTWAKGLNTAKQLINLVDRKATTDEVLEVFRLGIGDSVQVGELSNAELLATIGKLSPNNALLKGKNTVVDLFSASDAWTKISNYYNQVNILTKVYDQAGIDIDPEQIRRNAAERVKRTNLSYFRAPLLAKVPEATGLVWFTTYTWETYRSYMNSAKMVADDLSRVKQLREQGATEAADTLQSHAVQRAIGLSVSGPAMAAILGTAVNYAASVAWGDDDDEEKEKEDFIAKQALYDDQVGATPMVIHRGENGERIVFDMSRFDPRGPINEMARGLGRAAMSGDIESLFSTAKGAVIENTYLPELMKVGAYMLGASDPRSRGPSNIQNNYPEAWDAMKGFATRNGMDPKGVNEIGRGAFKLLPRTIGTGVGAVVNEALGEDGNNAPGFVNFMAGMGFNLQHYSPENSLGREARFNYVNQTNKARGTLHEYAKLPSNQIDGDRLEEMTLHLLNTEFDNWSSLRDKVVAAEYAGRTKAEIFKILFDSGLDKPTARALLRGEFIFRGITVDMVKGWRKEELDDAKNSKDRDEFNDIVEKYKLLGPSLINITNKYRKEFYHKEGGVK